MKTLLLISIVFLQGCMFQVIEYGKVHKALEFCADKGGLLKIIEHFSGSTTIRCQDDSTIDFEDLLRQENREGYLK